HGVPEHAALGFARIVDGDDALVLDRRGGLRLAHEPRAGTIVRIASEDLDRDGLLALSAAAEIDHTLRAAPEDAEDQVGTELGPDGQRPRPTIRHAAILAPVTEPRESRRGLEVRPRSEASK